MTAVEDIAAEAERDHKQILEMAWARIDRKPKATQKDMEAYIAAERIHRNHFMSESASEKRKRKPLSEILGATLDASGKITKAKK